MSGCLDKLSCSCGCLDPALDWLKPKRNMIASIVAGTLVRLFSLPFRSRPTRACVCVCVCCV